MNSSPTTLGPYTIVRQIGRGGMGVVYLAHDSRLGRDVAVKSLPPGVSGDLDRLARFEREARILASLNHPNISALYGLEALGGQRYLVMEFVDGRTLADELSRGPMALDSALAVAGQIADALEAAHEKGIVHRDLKPANIMLTPEGRVKVMDFGLAHAGEMNPASSSAPVTPDSPTVTTPVNSPTIPGVILGTAGYMSPEQARGRAVDKRSDNFSFGVVLYEMLTGASPFAGETISDSIGAVLHKNVDLALLPPETPARVRRALQRCLERDKHKRLRDIGDAKIELESPDAEPAPAGAARAPRGVLGWAAIAALLAVFALGGWYGASALRGRAAARVVKYDLAVEVDPPSEREFGDVKISPDGRFAAYVQGKGLLLRDVGSFEARTLIDDHEVIGCFWSPDSAWIGFHTANAVFKVPTTGGGATRLTSAAVELGGVAGGGWTGDGRIILNGEDGIFDLRAEGGAPRIILRVDKKEVVDYHDPTPIPGTNAVLFVKHRRDGMMDLCVLNGEEVEVLLGASVTAIGDPVWSRSGHVVFGRWEKEPTVWAIPFDAERLEATGEPFLLESGAWGASIADDGTVAMARGDVGRGSDLAWVTRAGEFEPIDTDFDEVYRPLVSPDGSALAFAAGTSMKADVWIHELDRKVNRRVTFLEGFVATLAWSPDGEELAVLHFTPGGGALMRTAFVKTNGGGESRAPIEGLVGAFDGAWTVGAFTEDPMASPCRIESIALEDPPSRTDALEVQGRLGGVSLSPDGRYLLYSDDSSGKNEVYCVNFPGGTDRWQVSTQGGDQPVWAADGKSLFFQRDIPDEGQSLYEVGVTFEPAVRFGLPVKVLDGKALGLALGAGWCPSPDGRRFAVVREPVNPDGRRVAISIIQNRLAPAGGR